MAKSFTTALLLFIAFAAPGVSAAPTTLPTTGPGSIPWLLSESRKSIADANDPVLAARLAAIQSRINDHTGFKELAALVQAGAPKLAARDRLRCWLYLAEAQHRLGLRDDHIKTLAFIHALGPDPDTLAGLARLHARVGDAQALANAFIPAPPPDIAARMHAATADEYLLQERRDAATRSAALALQAAAAIADESQRYLVLCELIDLLPPLDLRPEALSLAETFRSPQHRAMALICIAELYAHANRHDGVCDMLLAVTALQPDTLPNRIDVRLTIARLCARIGNFGLAHAHIKNARLAAELARPAERTLHYLQIAITLTDIKAHQLAVICELDSDRARSEALAEKAEIPVDRYERLLLDLIRAQIASRMYRSSTRDSLMTITRDRAATIRAIASASAAAGDHQGLRDLVPITKDIATEAIIHGQFARLIARSGDHPNLLHYLQSLRLPLSRTQPPTN